MFNYGDTQIGGNSLPTDASEAMTDLPQNRTLFIQQLTQEGPYSPQVVYDLKTIEEVFQHFQPQVDVEFETADGISRQETLRFGSVGDFSANNLKAQSPFLKEQAHQQEQYQKVVKQLRTNKQIQKVLDNPESKAVFLDALNALIQELSDEKA